MGALFDSQAQFWGFKLRFGDLIWQIQKEEIIGGKSQKVYWDQITRLMWGWGPYSTGNDDTLATL